MTAPNLQPKVYQMEKVLPCSLDAERFVLASILRDDSAWDIVVGAGLQTEYFSTEKHRRIHRRMCDVRVNGLRIDYVTVSEELKHHGELESVDGLSYLVSLDDGMPKLLNLESYVRLIKEKALFRRGIFIANQLSNRCYLEEGSPEAIFSAFGDVSNRLLEETLAGARAPIRSVTDLPSIRDFSHESVPYVLEPELPEATIVAVTGDAESGKSSLVTAWMSQASAGGRPGLILDRDNPAQVIRGRFDRLHIPEQSPIRVWHGGCSEEPPLPDSARVIDFVKACDLKPIILVDSFSAFYGADENDASQMRTFMNRLRRLTNLGATVILLHHEGKSESSKDYRGSSDFKAAIDVGFHVTNFGSDRLLDRLHLRCFKSRFGLTGGLVYQYADGRFRRDEESYAVARAVTTQLTEILKQNPGITGNRFDKLASSSGIGREKTRAFLRDGVEFQQIQKEPGPRNSGRYYLKSAEHPPRCGKVGELNSEKDFAGELANCDELKAMP